VGSVGTATALDRVAAMSSKVRKEDTNIFIGEPSQKKKKSVREGDINRTEELGAQWQLSVGVVGGEKDVACSELRWGCQAPTEKSGSQFAGS
jgi:hypothetical protein